MKTSTYILPAHWASALINGDTSGMEDAEEKELDDWLALEQPGYCVDCEDNVGFSWHNDATALGGDCMTFTFHTIEELT